MQDEWPPINPTRKDYIWWYDYSTRWGDNDIYGHVNNNIYYSMFDTVVNYFLITEADFDPIKSNYIGVTPETRCRYYKSIKYPTTVDVGIVAKKIGNSSIRYEVGVFKKNDTEPCAVGYFVHVYVDRKYQEKVIPIPSNIYKACKSILKSN